MPQLFGEIEFVYGGGGGRAERCDACTCISLGMHISPSAETILLTECNNGTIQKLPIWS